MSAQVPETFHLETRWGHCVDMTVDDGDVWVTVEGYSAPLEAIQLLQSAHWLLGAYLALTAGRPPRELEDALQTALAVGLAQVALEEALRGLR